MKSGNDFISNVCFKTKNWNGENTFILMVQRNFKKSVKVFQVVQLTKAIKKSRYTPKHEIKSETEKPKVDSLFNLPTNLPFLKKKYYPEVVL